MGNRLYMEMIYIDNDGDARHTDMAQVFANDDLTRAAFEGYRLFHIDDLEQQDHIRFLIDLWCGDDLIDTICLDVEAFKTITGQTPLPDEEYRRIDTEYWDKARKATNRRSDDRVCK